MAGWKAHEKRQQDHVLCLFQPILAWKCILEVPKIFQISNKARNSDSYRKIFLFLILKTNKNTLLIQIGDSRVRHQVRICLHMPQLRRGVSTRQNTVFSRQRKRESCGNSQKQSENSWTMWGKWRATPQKEASQAEHGPATQLPNMAEADASSKCLFNFHWRCWDWAFKSRLLHKMAPKQIPKRFPNKRVQAITEIQDTSKKKSTST